MKLLAYFVLASSVVLVVFAQYSDAVAGDKNENLRSETYNVIQNCAQENLGANVYPNATICLENAYNNSTNSVWESEEIIRNGISEAKKIVLESPEAAKKLLRQAYLDAKIQILKHTSPSLVALGKAVALSNEGSRQGISTACNYSQKAGLPLIDSLNVAENLLCVGLDSGGNASIALLEAGQLAADTAYGGSYRNIQYSVKSAVKGLRDAKSKPMQEAGSPNCESPDAGDDDALDAIHEINETADKARQRGANKDIVQKLSDVLICAVSRVAKIANKGINAANNLTTLADNEPFAALITYIKLVDTAKSRLNGVIATAYLALGEAELKSGNQSNSEIATAIVTLATAESEVSMALDSAKDLVTVGIGHKGDSAALVLATTAKIGLYCKFSLIQGIVKSAKLAFSVI